MGAEETGSRGRARGRPRRGGGVLAASLSTIVCLGAVEVGVRLAWDAQPEGVYPGDTGCCRGGALLPAVEGHDRFHRFRHNTRGYRGPEHAPGRRDGPRVAVVGDSFVYGVGVAEADALPGQLQAALSASVPGVEVINAGVPGANLDTDLLQVEKVARDYQPDVVLLVLLFNDLDLDTDARGARLPPMQASWVKDQGTPTWLWQLGNRMLPLPDPARGGAGSAAAGDPRFALARSWRSWMYAALELQRVGYRWEQGDRVLSIFHQDSRQVQAIAWQRTREGLQRFAALAAREGFQPGVVLFQHGPLEGIPALAIEGILAESGIPALDLDPLWGGYARFVREHSFRFDLHPRPAAHALAAQTLAAWMNHQGWLGAAPDPTATRWAATWPARVEQWRAGQRALAQEQRRQLRELEERYGAVLPAPGAPADQWLYGCWQQPQPGGPPAWLLSTRGGFKLRAADAGARALRVEGSRRDRPSDPPLSLAATCEGHSLGAPVTPTDARFTAQWSLPAPAPAGGLVECELVASGTVPGPRDPGGKPGIPSSFQLHRLELVP